MEDGSATNLRRKAFGGCKFSVYELLMASPTHPHRVSAPGPRWGLPSPIHHVPTLTSEPAWLRHWSEEEYTDREEGIFTAPPRTLYSDPTIYLYRRRILYSNCFVSQRSLVLLLTASKYKRSRHHSEVHTVFVAATDYRNHFSDNCSDQSTRYPPCSSRESIFGPR